MTAPERGLWIDDPRDLEDLATFLDRALRLDDAAVVRLRERGGGAGVVAWVATGLEVLASRVVTARVRPSDLSAGADALVTGLSTAGDGYVDPGFPMDSASPRVSSWAPHCERKVFMSQEPRWCITPTSPSMSSRAMGRLPKSVAPRSSGLPPARRAASPVRRR